MLQENFDIIYRSFRLAVYRRIFEVLGKREGSLTAADYFSVETIFLLGNPTITEFAEALSISAPNATYRVKSLIEKGYVVKTGTEKKNTFRLSVTEKFMRYYHDDLDYGRYVFKQLSENLDGEALKEAEEIFEKFASQIQSKGE